MSRAPFVLLAVGLVLGAAYDRLPTRPVVARAGYRVLAGDFHAHTRFSDGFLGPWDLVLHARRRGLDVVGVTEHNQVFPGKLARAFSRAIGGPTVVVGERSPSRSST
ncbi:MAG: PHP domain-containing protein [Myxococcales bacterium]|nr:PHP domain-containing protein [Myxococcales bacterium]